MKKRFNGSRDLSLHGFLKEIEILIFFILQLVIEEIKKNHFTIDGVLVNDLVIFKK
jgi:hypothetical protein